MREFTLASAVSAAVDVQSGPFDLGDKQNYAIHVNFSGTTLAGTLKLQAIATDSEKANSDWVDVASSSQAITSAASHMWNVSGAQYKWVRAAWTNSSGTGTWTVTLALKDEVITTGS